MIIDADIHVTLDNMDTLRPYLPSATAVVASS